jgi:hypothetical protein
MNHTSKESAATHLQSLKDLLEDIKSNMKKRLSLPEQDSKVLAAMNFVDPANWGREEEELANIDKVAHHFKETLASHSFNEQNLHPEWRRLKATYNLRYKGWTAKKLWQQVLQFKREDCPNICLLIELTLTIGPSNSMVKKCFSQLTSMLSDRRTNLLPDTMENLFLIQSNNGSWSPDDKEEIMSRALDLHMAKRRKGLLEQVPFNMIGVNSEEKETVTENLELEDDEEDCEGYTSEMEEEALEALELEAVAEEEP